MREPSYSDYLECTHYITYNPEQYYILGINYEKGLKDAIKVIA